MRRATLPVRLAAGFALALALASAPPARAQGDQQTMVDRATLTVQDMLGDGTAPSRDAVSLLRRARAAMICPRIFRAGFFLGGEGGDCVLVGRAGGGSWSSPAFYATGSGSFGLQVGIQDAQMIMLILTDRGLSAVMDSQFKVGADAALAIATLGGGIEGSTTAAVGADIVTYAKARGLFAGITVEGTLMSARSDWNRAYYGRETGPRQIVVSMEAHNPGADPLRAALTRFGSAPGAVEPAPAYAPQPGYAPQGPAVQTAPAGGSVQSAPLPPLGRPR